MGEKLIRLVRAYEYLYDISSRNYTNQQMKMHAWQKIGVKMNKPGEECQKLWMNLRSNYRKALQNRKLKSSDPNAKRRPIKFEKEMEFLKEFIHERKPRATLDSSSEDTQYFIKEETISDDEEERHFSQITNRSTEQFSTPTTTEILHKCIQSKKDIDPIDSFFETMAATLKTLPPKIQAEVKQQVFNVVTDAELKYLQEKEVGLVSTSVDTSIESSIKVQKFPNNNF